MNAKCANREFAFILFILSILSKKLSPFDDLRIRRAESQRGVSLKYSS